jgi:hypothetical protein
MPQSSQKPVSIVEAARLIYRTRSPSERQIRRVYQRMKAGLLEVHEYGGEPTEWTTTEQSLAEYLATSMVKPRKPPPAAEAAQRAGDGLGRRARRSTKDIREARRLRDVYRGMWRDYFLAVLLRRRTAHRSTAFRRAVVAGQAAILVGLIAVCAAAVRFAIEPVPPQRAAIDRWIDAITDRHEITRWHPAQSAPDGRGVLVEVEYRYASGSPRTIHTRRTFRVVGDEVSEVSID